MTFDKEEMDEWEEKLKPCPMCGSPAKFVGRYTKTGRVSDCYVTCTCERPCIRTSGYWEEPLRAYLVWNDRVQLGEEEFE